jgi:hypothetical protein
VPVEPKDYIWRNDRAKERQIIILEQGEPWDRTWNRVMNDSAVAHPIVRTMPEIVEAIVSSRRTLAIALAGRTRFDPWTASELSAKLGAKFKNSAARPTIYVADSDLAFAKFRELWIARYRIDVVHVVPRARMPSLVASEIERVLHRKEFAS